MAKLKRNNNCPHLFKEKLVPAEPGSGQFFKTEYVDGRDGVVECLGKTFPNDEARRKHFMELLREKLKDPEFRKIEGFPIGADEDILALSDPPYYTACPNPFISDFIKLYGKPYSPSQTYRKLPFSADVQEGRHEPVYLAHTYHAKVPYRAVLRYVLAYTEPGDVVFDGFAGTGMVGVACQLSAKPPDDLVKLLGSELPNARYGARVPIVSDLAPIASLIACNLNLPIASGMFRHEAEGVLSEVENQIGWMYETQSAKLGSGTAKYYVWSDLFRCPHCNAKIVYGLAAYDKKTKEYRDSFPCPACDAKLSKHALERVYETVFDPLIGESIKRIKQELIITSFADKTGRRHHREPVESDVAIVEKISKTTIPYDVPCQPLPHMHMTHERNNLPALGITHLHHFFTRRNLIAIGAFRDAILKRPQPVRRALMFWLTSCIPKLSRLMNYNADGIGRVTKGIFYFASISQEASPFHLLRLSMNATAACFDELSAVSPTALVSVASASRSLIADASIDYIFTDPPFGENIYYADLNYLWESWIGVFTQRAEEAIVSHTDGKDLFSYTAAMTRGFREYHRVLKPGRWMTVEFHNSQNAVWMAIQEALGVAGFVVADVRTLDKKLGTFKQIVTASTVKQDLIISAYRPNGGLEERFRLEAGTEDGVWDFTRTHLGQLPVFVSKDGQAEVIAERQNYMLFDRMVAFHVQRGVSVPMSASEFYAGLQQRFSEREGMYFLTDQVAEYDKNRVSVKEVLQLEIFVTDEASAIQWLKQQLTKKPQTFQEIHPDFMREIGGWQKHERPLELLDLLRDNFLSYDGSGDVPSQIHSHLSSNWPDLRKKAKDDPALRAKGKDRWYVPDPNKVGDLEKLRERSLLKEFDDYRTSGQKRLKVFRLEAVRAGFKKAWQERDYDTIIAVAQKIPEDVLQEDPKLLMWYDQAMTRKGETA